MDIRNAKRPEKGTTVSNITTDDTSRSTLTPVVNEDGTLNDPPKAFDDQFILKQSWEYLRENKITERDLVDVLDSILTTGNVQWEFKLFDKIDIVFKIRPSWVDDVIIDRIDEVTSGRTTVSALRYNNLIAESNLAASLTKYGDKTFDTKDSSDFYNVLDFVKSLPFVIRNRLVGKLAVFDRVVGIATSDWGLKNFTQPLKEK